VRKKSGEIVRPVLRLRSRRCSSPPVLTRSKSVHFNTHTDIRHFLHLDQPLAVSVRPSPIDRKSDKDCYPFEEEGHREVDSQLEIIRVTFPVDSPLHRTLPVRLERVWLSNDKKSLLGSAAVANIAFEKRVSCRFTFDSWETTSDIAARYLGEVSSTNGVSDYDRFIFSIELSGVADLDSKTLHCCFRYRANGQEFWDNNNCKNFRIKFRRIPTEPRLDQPYQVSTTGLPSRVSDPIFDGLSSRYDFGTALIAAVQNAERTRDDQDVLCIKGRRRPGSPEQAQLGIEVRGTDIESASYAELVDKYCFVSFPSSI